MRKGSCRLRATIVEPGRDEGVDAVAKKMADGCPGIPANATVVAGARHVLQRARPTASEVAETRTGPWLAAPDVRCPRR